MLHLSLRIELHIFFNYVNFQRPSIKIITSRLKFIVNIINDLSLSLSLSLSLAQKNFQSPFIGSDVT